MSINGADIFDFGAWIEMAPEFDWGGLPPRRLGAFWLTPDGVLATSAGGVNESGALRVSPTHGHLADNGVLALNGATAPWSPGPGDPGKDGLWAINSVAAAQGEPLTALSVIGPWLYSGFGDWGANDTETIAVVAHALDESAGVPVGTERVLHTGTSDWDTGGLFTEAIENVYGFGQDQEDLYVPHVDGLGYWEGCGYSVSLAGGEWTNVRLPGQALHVFQMAETSEGLWACGSRIMEDQETGTAALWHRPTGGDWTIRADDPATGNFSRYYVMQVDGNAVTVHNPRAGDQVGRKYTSTTMEEVSLDDLTPFQDYMRKSATVSVDGFTYVAGANGEINRSRNG